MSTNSPPEVVELRVHGVAGTPPEELLDRPLVRRVAGTKTAGFYRPRLAVECADDPPDGPPGSGAPLEGYSWGGLTSGAPSRALWLLLLPFTLVNLAPRLRPPSAHPAWALRGLWTTTRVLALSLTGGFALAAAGVGVDLFGWQCGAQPARTCSGPPGFLMHWVDGLDPGPRLAAGAVIPLLVLALLAVVGLATAARYEALLGHPAAGAVRAPPPVDLDELDPHLGHLALWANQHVVRRLRHLHLQVGIVTVLGVAVGPVRSPFGLATFAGIAVVLVLAVLLACSSAVAGRRPDEELIHSVPVALWSVTCLTGVLAAVALLTATDVDGAGSGAGLPGYAATASVFFAGQTVTVLAVGVCVLALRRASPERAPFAGLATVVVAAFALMVAGAFSAGTYVLAAAWLRSGSLRPSIDAVREAVATFDMPQPMLIGAVAFATVTAWAAVVLVALGLWVGYRLRWPLRWRRGVALLPVEYPDVTAAGRRTPRRDAQILRAWWLARLVDRAGYVLGVLFFPVLAFALVVAGEVALQQRSATAADLVAGLTSRPALVAVGANLVVGFLVLFITLGALAFRVPSTRRTVGILWDLASFWPRVTHPLAAPCYSERTLPDLVTRIHWYVAGPAPPGPAPPGPAPPSELPPRAVVLAGHSQGSVIGAALLAQLATADALELGERPVLPHVAFLSYGCVLRRLYARFFPAYFGLRVLRQLADDLTADGGLPRWRNLWRRSDHVGGAVDVEPWQAMDPDLPVCGPTDLRLADPVYAVPGDPADPAPRRHSGYQADPEFQRAVAELAELLPSPQGPTERQGRARSSAV